MKNCLIMASCPCNQESQTTLPLKRGGGGLEEHFSPCTTGVVQLLDLANVSAAWMKKDVGARVQPATVTKSTSKE